MWEHLADPLTTDESVSRIADLFSDPDGIEVLKGLSGGDVQSFIDMIDEVPFTLTSE